MRNVFWAFWLVCAVAVGQSFQVKTIEFDGAPQYTPAELMEMSGLKTGSLTKAELDEGLSKLDATGLFSAINYQTAGPVLHIKLEPMAGAGKSRSEEPRVVNYVNFVMFTPADLDAKVKARVPAYRGTVPVSGNMQVSIERALEAILAERGIVAKVVSIGAMGGGVLNYSIDQPQVVVSAVQLGVDLGAVPALAAVQGRYVGQPYLETESGKLLASNLLDTYQDLGYVDFQVGQIVHGPPVVGKDTIGVALVGTAIPGPLYRVSRVDLPAGVAGVTAADMVRGVDLKVGAPASRIEVLSATAHINGAFEGRGYLDAKTVVTPARDEAGHTMAYTFTTEPGTVYHMGSFRTSGLTAEQDQALAKAWPLAPGSVFEGGRMYQFTQTGAARTMCGGKAVRIPYKADKASHTVDVTAGCK